MRWRRSRTRRSMSPLGRFVRASLRRRIFAWMVGTLVFFAAAAFACMAALQHFNPAQDWSAGKRWYAQQLSQDFDDLEKRESLAKSLAALWALDLSVLDPNDNVLIQVGGRCQFYDLNVPIVRGEEQLGTLVACARNGIPWTFRPLIAFLFLVGVAWVVSEKVARRLARPLDELAHVAKRVGDGDWSARATLQCKHPDEIQVVADAVNDMATRIEKQLADQRELLATVSHEMRTPLARMRVITELARDGNTSPKTFDDLDREVIELDDLVGQLLASSRIEFGTLSKNRMAVPQLAAQALERSGCSATLLSCPEDLEPVEVDATLLHRALANILDNAKKHGRGPTALTLSQTSESVRFEVSDAGPGFAQGTVDSFFQKFSRAPGSHVEGLGLGLALVKRIAIAHGGTVWASNQVPNGAIVGFSIQRNARSATEATRTGHTVLV